MNRRIAPLRVFLYVNLLSWLTFANAVLRADDNASDDGAKVQDGFKISEIDWPWWRGPSRNGTASSKQSPPIYWNDNKNLVWKAPLPGRGHGSPTIVGSKIFLQTADESNGAQLVICLERSSGKQLWKHTVHSSGGMRKNNKSTAASSTPAS